MQVGKKVVCIDDAFNAAIRQLYVQLPKKGETYTIREVSLGRERLVSKGDSLTVRLLLEELHNPPDPRHKGGQELGFNAERFRELEEETESDELEEPVHSGVMYEPGEEEGESWKNAAPPDPP